MKPTSKEHTKTVAVAVKEIRKIAGTKFPADKTVKDICKKHNLNEADIRTIVGGKEMRPYQYAED